MNIAGVDIGPGLPCRFIGEVSNSHGGSLDRCARLIRAAWHAGADLIKLQAYTPLELVALRGDGPAPEPWGSQGYTMLTLYQKAQTPLEWMSPLFAMARREGIPLFSSVFGPRSLAALEEVDCPAYKISHFECQNMALVDAVKGTGKPVVISMPNLDLYAIRAADVALYCPGGYPCGLNDVHLPVAFGYRYHGLSSHCLAHELPVAAVARGCQVIEMHIQLRDEPSELEANVSLDEQQFAAMVRGVRRAELLAA